MQTSFRPEQLEDPQIAEAEKILRKCVHCGFCTATCPTYVTLGNELDSPRGRIYLIKDMLENDRPADDEVALHVDRCLSCLACTTTCPSGVDYMHLIDHARTHVEQTWKRPFLDRMIRAALVRILPYPGRFRSALMLARLGKPFRSFFARSKATRPLSAMLALAPQHLPKRRLSAPTDSGGIKTDRKSRVAILRGCAQSVLDPGINIAATALLERFGVEVIAAAGESCCGSLVHHMGRRELALHQARLNIDAWTRELEQKGLDAVIITTSGCGTTIKDYGHMLQHDPAYAQKAAKISSLACDVTEYLSKLDLPDQSPKKLAVTYHSACSMQHGQKITEIPKRLLRLAGFTVAEPLESHLCCGSAGTYNILQPDIAEMLKQRKISNLDATKPDVIVAGNIGCITQIASAMKTPVVHTVELLNWAYGGEQPEKLKDYLLA
ncbi:glycolate oxidase subunit GlcF [Oryzifoliimicrobium ureilyticus]|uniref:glycolate oxidase subunit GlcF n=1 Tax=Oryzifoliimicrobium ureilyticus TaxID=3113724 RepID=UPI0030767A16